MVHRVPWLDCFWLLLPFQRSLHNLAGVSCYTVAPTTIKKWITGKGNGKKEVMGLHIYKKFRLEPGEHFKNNDEMDGFAIADFGFSVITRVQNIKEMLPLNKNQESQIANYIKNRVR